MKLLLFSTTPPVSPKAEVDGRLRTTLAMLLLATVRLVPHRSTVKVLIALCSKVVPGLYPLRYPSMLTVLMCEFAMTEEAFDYPS